MAAGSAIVKEKKKPLQPGSVIRCKTTLGEKFEGEVLGFDEESKAIVIKHVPTVKGQQPTNKSIFDVTVINLALVDQSNFELISSPTGEPPPLPDIDKEKINKRLKAAIDRVGNGVSPEGQHLFDFLQKRISDCSWQGKDIYVLEAVIISPPYKLENCSGTDERTVGYIKSMVEKFYADKLSPTTKSSVTIGMTSDSAGIVT